MEEDIEYRIKRFLDECEDGNWYWDDGVDAIETLIKGYRELEEYYKEQNEVNAKFIPVSLVEEKIEELIKEGRHYNANKIEVLQELLEKRKYE